MIDPRLTKLAHLLVNYSGQIKKGDKVFLNGTPETEPLFKEVYAQILLAGGHPLLLLGFSDLEEIIYRHGDEEQLTFIHPPTRLAVETYDASIFISGTLNTKNLSAVDPARIVQRTQARREILDIFLKRAAQGKLRWVGTLFPTPAYVQDAEMSLRDFEDFVFSACMPDLNDPVGFWKRLSEQQERIISWLRGKRHVRITGPETDLELDITDRIFINCDGHHNMPDGEIFTGPVETSANGIVRFSYPAIYQGREFTGVRLRFQEGKVVEARADKNEDFLNKILNSDEGARFAGEFAIGTNTGIQRFTRQILFDEKIAGSFHLALGAGYPETGSINKSALHWDMICDLRAGGEIRVDGALLYKDGQFVPDLA